MKTLYTLSGKEFNKSQNTNKKSSLIKKVGIGSLIILSLFGARDLTSSTEQFTGKYKGYSFNKYDGNYIIQFKRGNKYHILLTDSFKDTLKIGKDYFVVAKTSPFFGDRIEAIKRVK